MARTEKRLDPFTAAYVEAMLWSTTDDSDEGGGEPLDKNYSIEDIAPETMELIVEDCADFQKRFDSLIIEEPEVRGEHTYGRWELAGHDFWLTRVGSGAGFWDGDWPKNGEELSEAARSYGGFDLYVGDDGVIYGPPPDQYRHPPDWLKKRHPSRGRTEERRTTVRDFNTRDELIEHSRQEGATHVVVVGSGATLYFPTQGGKYEEARAWRQNGYWHAPAPGARKVVDSLPRDAQPIGGARRAAEAPYGRATSTIDILTWRGEQRGERVPTKVGMEVRFRAGGSRTAGQDSYVITRIDLAHNRLAIKPAHFAGHESWVEPDAVVAYVTHGRSVGAPRHSVRDYVAVEHDYPGEAAGVRAPRRQVRDAKREADAGFAVDVYPQELVEENTHDRFNEDPEFRKEATKAGLLEIRSGDITPAGWAKLNADIRQIEGNALAWLHEKFTNVRDEGHGTHGDLIGTFWFDPTDPEQAHLVELAADTGRQERVDMVDASYGDLAKTAFDGVSDFGASVLGGGVTFFDVKPEDMEAVEETIASSRKRSTRESPRTARAPSGRPLRPPYRRR